ncbi:M20 metallopeptidase family protein [Enterocloster bolteae]|uniref:M20 metallopeptidase family protein n=1 Tax=Enterocloster bolteae TaxID=208479 RepID=UPI000407C38B|nr:M20 family metallopeptidase [Enterocloster bolteae]UOX68035.1 M20 family metallopeptidase [Enterocloster bolteae]
MNKYLQDAMNIREQTIAWRRYLHQIPEVGIHLPRTVTYITEQLEHMGVVYEVYEDCSCVVCLLGQGEPCVLLRGDIDGLAITEETGLPFACRTGNMHACGHDMHCAVMLAVTKILKLHEQELNGRVKILFQSGEEAFHGAAAAIKHGIMENPHVDAAYGAHVFAAQEMNTIAYKRAHFSSVYGFSITIHGKGTHGATPEMGVDPLSIGAHILLGLQELVAREVSVSDQVVLTVGHFKGGAASNVIPESAVLEGTLRTFDNNVRTFFIKRIQEVAESIAHSFRGSVEIKTLSDCPAVTMDEQMGKLAEIAARKVCPEVSIDENKNVMISDDFAFFSDLAPSVYFIIGGGMDDKDKWVSQHNPKIIFNEESLPISAAIYVQIAVDWLDSIKGE